MTNLKIDTWFPKSILVADDVMSVESTSTIKLAIKKILDTYGCLKTGGFSVDSTHQTYDKLHQEIEFNELSNRIMSIAGEFAKTLGYSDQKISKFYIRNMWVNISYENDFNFPHCHPDGLISGAYYITAPSNSTITFFNNITSMLTSADTLNELSYDTCSYDCIENRLILFKSDFIHGNLRQGPGEKIVVSFNISLADKQ